jgi:hypothetical protein
VNTGPVAFSWQEKFLNVGAPHKAYVIQKIEKNFTFTTAPATPYSYTPLYWEAFPLLYNGSQTDIDYWQFDLPDGTSGTWAMKGTCYFSEQLPTGMVVGNVPDAGDLPSTTTQPKGLGHALGVRQIGAKFDFTAISKFHIR